jgi:membrane-bound ClpP family serine protease
MKTARHTLSLILFLIGVAEMLVAIRTSSFHYQTHGILSLLLAIYINPRN